LNLLPIGTSPAALIQEVQKQNSNSESLTHQSGKTLGLDLIEVKACILLRIDFRLCRILWKSKNRAQSVPKKHNG